MPPGLPVGESTEASHLARGQAVGNGTVRRLRAHVEDWLFALGCRIHQNPGKVLLGGVLALGALAAGLRLAHLQTDLEVLWVQAGGRLSEEIAYTQSKLGPDGQLSFQALIQTPRPEKRDAAGVLTAEALTQHLRSAKAASRVTVRLFGRTWDLNRICYKAGIPLTENYILQQAMERLIPCVVVTPLDCFWDGAKLQSGKFYLSSALEYRWTNLDPQELIRGMEAFRDLLNLRDLEELLERAQVGRAYMDRPCLDPQDPGCPDSAPNKQTGQPVDVMHELASGCSGFSRRFMHWQRELIVGGARENASRILQSAEALQTMFVLMDSKQLHETYKDNYDIRDIGWSEEKASAILDAWQRKFVRVVHGSVRPNSSQQVHAFSTTSLHDLLWAFSDFRPARVATACALMLVFTCMALFQCDCTKSQGAVGIAGLMVVVLSVAAALGVSSILGLDFNAASTQVLPFIALGSGMKDIFLLAHVFAWTSINRNIPGNCCVGDCLRECGPGITLCAVCNLVVFLLAALIPIPALQAFSLQAAIVVVLNIATTLLVFPAILALDLCRRRGNRMDVLCCLASPCSNRVVAIDSRLSPAFNGPTQCSPPEGGFQCSTAAAHITLQATLTAVARYDASGQHIITLLPATISTPVSTSHEHPTTGEASAHPTMPGPESCSSTRDLIARMEEAGPLEQPSGLCCGNRHWTLSRFGFECYAPLLTKGPVKAAVLLSSFALLGTALYGASYVPDGLPLAEVVPRGGPEHAFLAARACHFPAYSIRVATTADVDYPSAQMQIFALHEHLRLLPQAAHEADGRLPKTWLHYFRDWLLDLQRAFDEDWAAGRISVTSFRNGSESAVLALRLLVQTGDPDASVNFAQLPGKRLVDSNGIIDPATFYVALTAWVSSDPLGVAASQAALRPSPPDWIHDKYSSGPDSMIIPAADPLEYSHFAFYLRGLREAADFVEAIRAVRAVTKAFSAQGLPCYPTGLPFLFWEQYLGLRHWLALAVGLALAAVFFACSVGFASPGTAVLVILVLALTIIELFGSMALLGLRLSAISAVLLVISIGLGAHSSVHLAMAFLNSRGTIERRLAQALGQILPPITKSAVCSLLGLTVLAASEFDFIVRYFFAELALLSLLALLNGLLVLPVLLATCLPGTQHEMVEVESLPTDQGAPCFGTVPMAEAENGTGPAAGDTFGPRGLYTVPPSSTHPRLVLDGPENAYAPQINLVPLVKNDTVSVLEFQTGPRVGSAAGTKTWTPDRCNEPPISKLRPQLACGADCPSAPCRTGHVSRSAADDMRHGLVVSQALATVTATASVTVSVTGMPGAHVRTLGNDGYSNVSHDNSCNKNNNSGHLKDCATEPPVILPGTPSLATDVEAQPP
uniref:Patched 2 n=2 Tax=Eptatretus burgeri TaxID=7764 RepID=A0A8C4PWY8_EPTBU